MQPQKEGEHGCEKMGRPTDNPKDKTLFVRLDNESSEVLEAYCEEKQVPIKSLLSPEEYRKLEEMEDLKAQSDAIENVDLFEYGFGMDALMIDIFGLKEKRLCERESE